MYFSVTSGWPLCVLCVKSQLLWLRPQAAVRYVRLEGSFEPDERRRIVVCAMHLPEAAFQVKLSRPRRSVIGVEANRITPQCRRHASRLCDELPANSLALPFRCHGHRREINRPLAGGKKLRVGEPR